MWNTTHKNGSNGNGTHALGHDAWPAIHHEPSAGAFALVGGGEGRFRYAPLEPDAAQRGDNVELRWNFEALPASTLRVVLYLHGFASSAQQRGLADGSLSQAAFLREKAASSGLRFTEAVGTAHGKPPVLAIIPRGMKESGGNRRFGFSNVVALARSGSLRTFVEACLQDVSRRHFNGQLLRYEQLYLFGHSGGGAGINALLASGVDPDAVACFDSTYDSAAPIIAWMRAHHRAQPPRDFGVRVLVSRDSHCSWSTDPATGRPRRTNGTEVTAREILAGVPGGPTTRRRIEHTTAHHGDVDGTYTCPLALDIDASLDGLRSFTVVPLASMADGCARPSQPARAPATGHGLEAEYAEGLTAHPVHVVTGNVPPTLFSEDDPDPANDTPLTTLGQLAGFPTLVRSGLVTATPVAAASPFQMRVRGRLVVPSDLARRAAGSVPVVFILMGNHAAFDPGTGRDVENFNGYDYLQQHLAGLGIASCSVDTNLANALNLGIRTRAEMLVKTMSLVRTSAPAAILPKLDFARVGLIGHSRGGEAVAQAVPIATAAGFTILSVGSIAPTDFSLGRASPLRLSGNVRFLVLHGSHDGDVGDVLFNGFGLYDRAVCDKTLVYARGLTHNRFNSVWNECADYGDGRHAFVDDFTCRTRGGPFDTRVFAAVVHREYAKFFMEALVKRTLLRDATAENVLRGLVAPTRAQLQQQAGAGAGPAASIQWSLRSSLTVDEFDAPGVGPRTPTGGSIARAFGPARPTVPHITQAYIASAAGHKIKVDLPAAQRNLSTRSELTFRLTSMIPVTSEAAIAAAAAADWVVRIRSSLGVSGAAGPAQLDLRGLREPNRPFFHELSAASGGNVTKNQYDTLSLPKSAFTNVNWADVQSVEFEARGGSFPILVDSFAFV